MRCPHCGSRIPDAVAAKTAQCPNCRRALGPQEEDGAAEPGADSLADLTLPYIPGEAPPGAAATGGALPDGKKAVTETGAHRKRAGAYTARFEHDDDVAAVTAQASPAPEHAKPVDAAGVVAARDRAATQANPAVKAAAGKKERGALPERLGHFHIKGKLGEGGMGAVFDGYDPQLDRRVAIKVLSSRLGEDEQFVQRFLSEARAVARIAHVNVAGVYFADSDGDRNFFAMEFIEGQSLDELVEKGGALTPKTAIGYIIQAVRGLAAAHERGIVHRDIKPANLMLGKDGVVKVTDFGLAKLSGEDVSRTRTGAVMGSPHFMAPEQGRGEETDLRADVYSLGATLYYLLTGKTPYEGDSAVAVILKHQEAPVPRIVRAPPSVDRLLNRMMAKDTGGRYQGYANLMTDLVRLDRSGLLRDDVTLEAAGAATAGAGGMAVSPAAGSPGSGAAPARAGGVGLATQKADDGASLLSQLDAVMKNAPKRQGDTLATRKISRGGIRSVAASVTKKILQSGQPAAGGAEAAEAAGEFDRPFPVGRVVGGVLVVLFLLIVFSLKPWSWGGSAEEESLGTVERPEVLEAIDRLRPALAHELPEARRNAILVLGRPKLNGPTAEGLLVSMLADQAPMVRAEAAKVLGRAGRRSEVQWHVLRLLSDDSPEVRQVAAEALEELTGYTRLTRIDWGKDAAGLRRAVKEEFEVWLKGL